MNNDFVKKWVSTEARRSGMSEFDSQILAADYAANRYHGKAASMIAERLKKAIKKDAKLRKKRKVP